MTAIPAGHVECSLHKGATRPARYLERLPSGEYRCKESDRCRVKPPRPEPVVGEDGTVVPPVAPVDTCDLCHQDIHDGTIDDHIVKNHATLLRYCNTLVDQAPAMASAQMPALCIATLGRIVMDLALRSDPGPQVFQLAVDARDQLEVILQTKFPQCKVYTFGSCVASGCWDGRGDVDFTIVDPAGWDSGQWPGVGEAESNVISKATRCLREAGFHFDELTPLLRTRVPIVKHESKEPIDADMLKNVANRSIRFEIQGNLSESDAKLAEGCFPQCKCRWEGYGGKKSKLIVQFPTCAAALKEYMSPTNLMIPSKPKIVKKWLRYGYRPSIFSIQFDLSARGFGVRNSFLLRAYMMQSPEIRCGSVFIKHWSKYSGVNYSMKGYITSYAVNLMWIYYLIVKKEVSFVDPQSILASMHDKRDFGYLPMRASKNTSPQDFEKRVGELVANFFKFYALEFDWKNDVVTVSRSHHTTKQSLSWTEANEVRSLVFRERVWYRFCIEDPFEDNLNLARHISPIKLNKVRMEFLRAYECALTNAGDKILLDRSASATKVTCVQLVHRSLAGEQSMPLNDVIQAIRDSSEESLAAFEVENTTNSIFKLAGLSVKDGVVAFPPNSKKSLMISKAAKEHIATIDKALAAEPLVGVIVTDELYDSNLHNVYFHDEKTDRFYICERDASKMREYIKIVNRATDAFRFDEADEPTEASFRDLLKAADIVIDEGVFQAAKKVLIASVVDASMEKLRTTHRNMNTGAKKVGTCGECGAKAVDIFPSFDSADKGSYCSPCWGKY